MKIFTFDTTLRDGTQGESVSFSVDDKLLIAQKLDELGIDYIEGGWPGSNPKDKDFFARAQTELKLKHAKLTAFGATIFGKSWDLHTARALGISEEENLKLISETVAYLKEHGKEVVYDAEHFFDGYTSNPDFALRTLEAAKSAGGGVSNASSLPLRGWRNPSRAACSAWPIIEASARRSIFARARRNKRRRSASRRSGSPESVGPLLARTARPSTPCSRKKRSSPAWSLR